MNMLVDRLPHTVQIAGVEVPINTDFRVWIRFELMNLDDSISGVERAQRTLKSIFPDLSVIGVGSFNAIVEAISWFYGGGDRKYNMYEIREQERMKNKAKKAEENGEKVSKETAYYDYVYDADYIFAAFMQQYGIDLNSVKMHWWKFKALFRGLTDQTRFKQIVSYRSMEITSGMSDAEKRQYRELKAMYALPLPLDEVEKIKNIQSALESGDPVAIMQIYNRITKNAGENKRP